MQEVEEETRLTTQVGGLHCWIQIWSGGSGNLDLRVPGYLVLNVTWILVLNVVGVQ